MMCTSWASIYNRETLTQALLQAGFDPAKNDRCVLSLCCEYGYSHTLELLLSNDRNSGYKLDPSENYNSPIWNACRWDHADCVKLLLADCRVDPGDRNGECLVMASRYKHVEIEKILLEQPLIEASAK